MIHTSWDLCSKGLEFCAWRQILGSAKLSSKQHFMFPGLSNSSIPSKLFNTKWFLGLLTTFLRKKFIIHPRQSRIMTQAWFYPAASMLLLPSCWETRNSGFHSPRKEKYYLAFGGKNYWWATCFGHILFMVFMQPGTVFQFVTAPSFICELSESLNFFQLLTGMASLWGAGMGNRQNVWVFL